MDFSSKRTLKRIVSMSKKFIRRVISTTGRETERQQHDGGLKRSQSHKEKWRLLLRYLSGRRKA